MAVARARRTGEELSLLVVDVDGLKRINDLGGHTAGDEALQALAEALTSTTRATDVSCRLGGDEFAVILPGSSPSAALVVAERAQSRLVELGRGQCSFSGGIARSLETSCHAVRPLPFGRHRRLPRASRRAALGPCSASSRSTSKPPSEEFGHSPSGAAPGSSAKAANQRWRARSSGSGRVLTTSVAVSPPRRAVATCELHVPEAADRVGVGRDDDRNAGVAGEAHVLAGEVEPVGKSVHLERDSGLERDLDHALEVERVRRAVPDQPPGRVAQRTRRRDGASPPSPAPSARRGLAAGPRGGSPAPSRARRGRRPGGRASRRGGCRTPRPVGAGRERVPRWPRRSPRPGGGSRRRRGRGRRERSACGRRSRGTRSRGRVRPRPSP